MKLKLFNIITALLICTYVFSTIGFSVIEHYCGGELEEVAVFSKPDSCCGGDEVGSENTEDDCCKNETTHIAFHKDFVFKIDSKKSNVLVLDLVIVPFSFNKLLFTKSIISSAHHFVSDKTPPPKLLQQSIVDCSVIRV